MDFLIERPYVLHDNRTGSTVMVGPDIHGLGCISLQYFAPDGHTASPPIVLLPSMAQLVATTILKLVDQVLENKPDLGK